MDRNIAAILREDARTVHCSFELDDPALDFPSEEWIVPQAPGLPGNALYQHPKRPGPKVETSKLYTYVTDLALKPQDIVAVPVQGTLKLVRVVHVDDIVDVEPNSAIEIKWVICKVDLLGYAENLKRNKAIADTVAEATRVNMRSVFQNQILSGLAGEHKDRMSKLLGVAK
jgi:hypothetical protein